MSHSQPKYTATTMGKALKIVAVGIFGVICLMACAPMLAGAAVSWVNMVVVALGTVGILAVIRSERTPVAAPPEAGPSAPAPEIQTIPPRPEA